MPFGFLYFSDDERHGDLVDRRGYFTDTLPTAPKVELRQVVLVSLDGEAWDIAAVMTRGQMAANYKWRVKFENVAVFDPPLLFHELKDHLSSKAWKSIAIAKRTKGMQLNEEMWEEFRRIVVDRRPDVDLTSLQRKASARRPHMSSGGSEPIVAFEHDAVGLALSLTGIDRKPVLESWNGSEDAPFLTGLSEFKLLEDRMIEHDAGVFGDWEQVRRGAVGIAEFRNQERRLTVINVNRAGVEHALGVDLVYYNHDFDSYVLVQYKRMTARLDRSGYEFRPDEQLRKELDRMRTLVAAAAESSSPRDFRLDAGGAFLKLCPSTADDAFSYELIRGMYLPLGYWDALVDSLDVLGPKGGVCVNFDNVGRHINNTLFIELVGSSWIGSRGVTSKQITGIVRGSLAARSLILAEARSIRPR